MIHPGVVRADTVAVSSDGDVAVGRIAILEDLSPEPVLRVIIAGAVGVVARAGGVTAHGAALLREASLPAVVATDYPIEWVGRAVVLNADEGYVGLPDDPE